MVLFGLTRGTGRPSSQSVPQDPIYSDSQFAGSSGESSVPGPLPQGRVRLSELFANVNFAKLWVGQLVSYLGDRIDHMAMMSIFSAVAASRVAATTDPAVKQAAASAAADQTNMIIFWATLPYVMVSPFSGALVDRFDRRTLMILMDLLRGLVVVLLPFTIGPYTHPWIIYAVIGSIGVATSVYAPAKSAFIPEIVPGEHLLRANSVTSTMNTLTVLIGTLVGGKLVELFGYKPSLFIDAGSYLFSASMLLLIRRRKSEPAPLHEQQADRAAGYFGKVKAGLVFITRQRVPGLLVCLDSWFFIIGGALFAVVTKIVYIRLIDSASAEAVGAGQAILGYAYGSLGAGLAVGGVLTGRHGAHVRLGKLLAACYAAAGVFILALAIPAGRAIVYPLLFATGYAAGGVIVAIETGLQKSVPDRMRGRVFALSNLMLNATLLVAIWIASAILMRSSSFLGPMLFVLACLAFVGAVAAVAGVPQDTTLSNLKVAADADMDSSRSE